jgi:hypothetical protein
MLRFPKRLPIRSLIPTPSPPQSRTFFLPPRRPISLSSSSPSPYSSARKLSIRPLSFGTFGRMLGRGLRVPITGAAVGGGAMSAAAYQMEGQSGCCFATLCSSFACADQTLCFLACSFSPIYNLLPHQSNRHRHQHDLFPLRLSILDRIRPLLYSLLLVRPSQRRHRRRVFLHRTS